MSVSRQVDAQNLKPSISGEISATNATLQNFTLKLVSSLEKLKAPKNATTWQPSWIQDVDKCIDKTIQLLQKQKDIILSFKSFSLIEKSVRQLQSDLNSKLAAYQAFFKANEKTIVTAHFNQYSAMISDIMLECTVLAELLSQLDKHREESFSYIKIAYAVRENYLEVERDLLKLPIKDESTTVNANSYMQAQARLNSQYYDACISSRIPFFAFFDKNGKLENLEKTISLSGELRTSCIASIAQAKSAVDLFSKIKNARDAKQAELRAKQQPKVFSPASTSSVSATSAPQGEPLRRVKV